MMAGAFNDRRVFAFFHGGNGGKYCAFPQCAYCRFWRRMTPLVSSVSFRNTRLEETRA